MLQVYITVVFYMKKITICPKTLYRRHNWENKNVVPNSHMFLIAPPHPMTTLYKSMIRSWLEYCSALWNPSKITDIQTLANIQRSFTSKIESCRDLNYYQRLSKLKLMSLQRRRERYQIIHMNKVLHNISPNDLNIKFHYCDRRGIQAAVPPLHRGASSKAQQQYDASFAVMGPKLWNTIPKSTTHQPTLEIQIFASKVSGCDAGWASHTRLHHRTRELPPALETTWRWPAGSCEVAEVIPAWSGLSH